MSELKKEKKGFNYRSVIGSLNFLTNSTWLEVQLVVHQYKQFSANPKLLHNQAVKRVLDYLKSTPNNGLIMEPDPEKGIEWYLDDNFAVGWNQEEGRYPGSVWSRTSYVIMYANCPII